MQFLPITQPRSAGRFSLPEDGFIPVLRKGQFPHEKSGLVQIIDDQAVTSVFNSLAAPIRIDFAHESYDSKQSSEAAGWIEKEDLQIRPDGLYAQPRWTDSGEVALNRGTHRYLSPAFLKADLEFLESNYVRPQRLDSAGLTNSPQFVVLGPLTNRLPGRRRESRHACDFRRDAQDFLVLVNRSRIGKTFGEAWRSTAALHPVTFAGFLKYEPSVFCNRDKPLWLEAHESLRNAMASIRNRQPDFRVINPQDWERALREEPKRMECVQCDDARRSSGVPQIVTPDSINAAVRSRIGPVADANPTWSRAQLYEHLKEAWPELWATWVIVCGGGRSH